jgi:hypothetical protein
MNKKYLLYLAMPFVLASCGKDKDTILSKTITINSDKNLDGYILNSSPKTVKDVDSRLKIGWDGGAASRAFLSFDISAILPGAGKTLVIERAVLKVYEQNTNMLPFNGEGVTRVVETYLLDYGTLDATDFDRTTIDNCGVIANWGYNVLEEHTLNVLQPVVTYLKTASTISKLQFRLQFTHNENVAASSTLDVAMWCIYSGEDQGTYNSYRPLLEITYHWD